MIELLIINQKNKMKVCPVTQDLNRHLETLDYESALDSEIEYYAKENSLDPEEDYFYIKEELERLKAIDIDVPYDEHNF